MNKTKKSQDRRFISLMKPHANTLGKRRKENLMERELIGASRMQMK